MARARLAVSRHRRLAIRFHWGGVPFWEGTGLVDTPEHRQQLAPTCAAIGAELERGTFDARRYLHWFPKGNQAARFLAADAITAAIPTIRDYAVEWLDRQAVEGMRHSTHATYRSQLLSYVTDARLDDGTVVGNLRLDELTTRRLIQLRTALRRRVSLSTARNVMGGGLRAMLNGARAEELLTGDPFIGFPRWPASERPEPDPFTEAERDTIVEWFATSRVHYWPFVVTLFGTGMRPSEATALRWSDVDVGAGRLRITKSRVGGQEAGPKTTGSRRTIDLAPSVVEALRAAQPLRPLPAAHVFTRRDNDPLEQKLFGQTDWLTALRALELRVRGLYSARHTFLSLAVSQPAGPRLKWLAEYCGTSVRMIERHYALYMPPDGGPSPLSLLGSAAGTPRRRSQVG